MLFLFDIDGTLVDTGGAGLQALEETNLTLFQAPGPPLDLAGATDLGIVDNVHRHFGIEVSDESINRYFDLYHQRLEWNLSRGGFPGKVLNGVHDLLGKLAARPGSTLALLTGNTQAGAAAKMRHFQLDHHFPFGAYGSDHADRNQLGHIALERAHTHTGKRFQPEEIWVIGDTPKDIACAHAIGARCLAVATGRFTVEELTAFGADHTVESLDRISNWI